MTRHGKIARLPKAIRDELNRRMDNNEPGKKLIQWLNALPEVQSVIAAEFSGKPIREQNLSEWRKGGYQDWRLLQERLAMVRQLEENAGTIGGTEQSKTINRHLSLVLTAELAQALQDLARQEMDPRERVQCLAQIVGRFAQLRREESNAGRAELAREQWDDELAKKRESERAGGRFMPLQALSLQQMYIEFFSWSDAQSLLDGNSLADAILADTIGFPAASAKANPAQSG